MKISEAKNQVKNAIIAYMKRDEYGRLLIPQQRQRPIFLLGAPGLGKTNIIEQLAAEMELPLVSYSMTHHTRQSAIGLPFIANKTFEGREYRTTEYTLSEIIASVLDTIERTGKKEGILFLDEINCVSETLSPAMLQFLQYKVFGQHKVPEGWVIVTAGNPAEFNDQARVFDMVTLDRVKKVEVDISVDAWLEYANATTVHPAIVAFISIYKNMLMKVEKGVDGMHVVTPRSWVDLSDMLKIYESTGLTVDDDLLGQYLQDAEINRQFAAYYELFKKYRSDYGLDDIFGGKWSPAIAKRAGEAAFDEHISLLNMMLERAFELTGDVIRNERINKGFIDALGNARRRMTAAASTADQLHDTIVAIADELKEGIARKHAGNMISSDDEEVELGIVRTLLDNAAAEDFPALIKVYEKESKRLKKLGEESSKKLDASFVFLEEAFGPKAQEVLIYSTSLTQNKASSKFLKDYGCKKYFENIGGLQLYARNNEVLDELKELEQQQLEFDTSTASA